MQVRVKRDIKFCKTDVLSKEHKPIFLERSWCYCSIFLCSIHVQYSSI